MKENISLNDISDVMLEVLESGGEFVFRPKGSSMLPLIKSEKTPVILKKPSGILRVGDVPLCKRKSGSYVFHRVVGYHRDGGYVLRGDNELRNEVGFDKNSVLAVMVGYYRGKRRVSLNSLEYKLYMNVTRRLWRFGKRVKNKLKKFLGEI